MGTTPRPPVHESGRTYEVEWTTISYRTIAFYAVLVLLLAGFVIYLIAPNYFGQKVKDALAGLSARVGQGGGIDAATSKREAHFVNIDGTVRVKKAQSLQW